jgi:hypothetical protein
VNLQNEEKPVVAFIFSPNKVAAMTMGLKLFIGLLLIARVWTETYDRQELLSADG